MILRTPCGAEVLLDDDVIIPGSISLGSHGYAQFWDGRTVTLLHRWLLGLEKGDGMIVDHISRDVLDNRRENLRVVTPAESNLNRVVAQRDLPTGVYLTRSGTFQARIKRNRKQVTIGTFGTVDEAAAARESVLI